MDEVDTAKFEFSLLNKAPDVHVTSMGIPVIHQAFELVWNDLCYPNVIHLPDKVSFLESRHHFPR